MSEKNKYKKRRQWAISAVSANGMDLDMFLEFKNDMEVVKIALSNAPLAFKYVSSELQHNKEVLDLLFAQGYEPQFNDMDDFVSLIKLPTYYKNLIYPQILEQILKGNDDVFSWWKNDLEHHSPNEEKIRLNAELMRQLDTRSDRADTAHELYLMGFLFEQGFTPGSKCKTEPSYLMAINCYDKAISLNNVNALERKLYILYVTDPASAHDKNEVFILAKKGAALESVYSMSVLSEMLWEGQVDRVENKPNYKQAIFFLLKALRDSNNVNYGEAKRNLRKFLIALIQKNNKIRSTLPNSKELDDALNAEANARILLDNMDTKSIELNAVETILNTLIKQNEILQNASDNATKKAQEFAAQKAVLFKQLDKALGLLPDSNSKNPILALELLRQQGEGLKKEVTASVLAGIGQLVSQVSLFVDNVSKAITDLKRADKKESVVIELETQAAEPTKNVVDLERVKEAVARYKARESSQARVRRKALEQSKAKEQTVEKEPKAENSQERDTKEKLNAILQPYQAEFDDLLGELKNKRNALHLKAATNNKYQIIAEETSKLCTLLKQEGDKFFENPSANAYQFKRQCGKAFDDIEKEAAKQRGWYAVHQTIRAILSVLSAITILPALCVAAFSKHGYAKTFFGTPPATETLKKIKPFRNELNKIVENSSIACSGSSGFVHNICL